MPTARMRVRVFCACFLQVKTLNRRVVELMGFDKWIPVSGQTYSRKIDYQVRTLSSGNHCFAPQV